jgi:hypothetical protein
MILSGLLFSFDKLNELVSNKGRVPIIADLMASRWAYEAMATYQFKNNDFEQPYFEYEHQSAIADFNSAYLADELKQRNQFLMDNHNSKNDSIQNMVSKELTIIYNSLAHESYREGIENLNLENTLLKKGYSSEAGAMLDQYLNKYKKHYLEEYNHFTDLVEKKMAFYEKNGLNITEEKNNYFNESMADLVQNTSASQRMIEYKGKLLQTFNPIFQLPQPTNRFDYRTVFFVPEKNLAGYLVSTYWFNLLVIWLMTCFCYLLLYHEFLRKFIDFLNRFEKS